MRQPTKPNKIVLNFMNKTKYTTTFLLITIAILFNSCYTGRKIEFEILVPAEVKAPDNKFSIAIAEHNKPGKKTRYFKFMDKVLKDDSRIDTLLPGAFVTGMKSILYDSPALGLIEDTLKIPLTSSFPHLKKFKKEQLNQIVSDIQTDMLLVLESIDAQDAIDIFYTDYDIVGEMRIIVHASVRLYDTEDGDVLLRKGITDTLYWYASGYNRNEILEQLPSRGVAYDDAAYAAGQKLAKYISPYWLNVQRAYYTSLKNEFATAEQAMDKGNWEEAAMQWTKLTNEKNANMASKACFNMAMVAEYNGSLTAAEEWLRKSLELKPSEAAKQYLLIIEERLKLEKLLDYQINRFD